MISAYNGESPLIKNIRLIVSKELKLFGFLYLTLEPKYIDEFYRVVPTQLASGALKYTEDINDNVEFFGKIKPQLAAGQDTGRDLICVTDWLAARLIRFGWVQKLDPANLPPDTAAITHKLLALAERQLR